MTDPGGTRIVRLHPDVDRAYARNDCTRVATPRPLVALVDHRSLFNAHQAAMANETERQSGPGVAVFALSPDRGLCGQMWLRADEGLRSATVGRHSHADLFLPWEEELSLRHLLVLVHAAADGDGGGRTDIRLLDLKSPAGFQAEKGGILRAAQADGPAVFTGAGYVFVVVPTAAGVPWQRAAVDPWSTFPMAKVIQEERVGEFQPARRREVTHVTPMLGPVEMSLEADSLREADEPVRGLLTLRAEGEEQTHAVGGRALARGVLLGRYERCGLRPADLENSLSRVHALLLEWEGQLHLIDTGSTNGTWEGERELKCARVVAGQRYRLGKQVELRWEGAQ